MKTLILFAFASVAAFTCAAGAKIIPISSPRINSYPTSEVMPKAGSHSGIQFLSADDDFGKGTPMRLALGIKESF